MAITQTGLKEIQDALDALGVALADHNHQWTDKERKLYEGAKDTLFLETAYLEGTTAMKSTTFPIDIKHLEVVTFAKAMDEVLCAKDYRGGWQQCTLEYLRARLVEEVGEYFAWVANNEPHWAAKNMKTVKKELVDIANFAMMLWDRT